MLKVQVTSPVGRRRPRYSKFAGLALGAMIALTVVSPSVASADLSWKSITTDNYTSCGVTTTGQGLCWGDNGSGQTSVPTGKTWTSITT
ncbi:MAG: RCC1 domain-containing protein, partial [Actinomycetes bacterium]